MEFRKRFAQSANKNSRLADVFEQRECIAHATSHCLVAECHNNVTTLHDVKTSAVMQAV